MRIPFFDLTFGKFQTDPICSKNNSRTELQLYGNVDNFHTVKHGEVELEGHTELLFRTDEARDPALIKTILRYERHMAVYLGLRVSGDKRRPADLGVNYPADICHLVEHRVNELEETLSTLRGDKTSTHAAARLSECRQ